MLNSLLIKRKLCGNMSKSPSNQKQKHDDLENDENGEKSLKKDAVERGKIIALSKKSPALFPNIGLTWFRALEKEFQKDYFKKLGDFLLREQNSHTIYPPRQNIYSWTTTAEINDVKVVILGQDPYHGLNQAHGLAFSVRKGIPIPKSLVNIFKELRTDIPGFKIPSHGCLYGWATQGVLLLNTSLTVRAHCANSHQNKGWECFTDAVIEWINTNLSGVVFLLWGGDAKKKSALIDKKKHLILTAAHPSPLSAHRGFFGCGHFSKTNDYLQKCNKTSINWANLP